MRNVQVTFSENPQMKMNSLHLKEREILLSNSVLDHSSVKGVKGNRNIII